MKSCSTFNIAFVFYILTPSIGEVVYKHTSHYNQGDDLYHLVAHTLTFQFRDTFNEHFSPHYFGVTIRGGCEIVVHGVQMMLDLHLD